MNLNQSIVVFSTRRDSRRSRRAPYQQHELEPTLKTVKLREVAHSRSGEKGRDSNVSVIAYNEADYQILCEQVTVASVQDLFGPITKGRITRFEVPGLAALNFVVEDVLEGGRSRTLAFDESGKALSSLMLRHAIQVPDSYVERSRAVGGAA